MVDVLFLVGIAEEGDVRAGEGHEKSQVGVGAIDVGGADDEEIEEDRRACESGAQIAPTVHAVRGAIDADVGSRADTVYY